MPFLKKILNNTKKKAWHAYTPESSGQYSKALLIKMYESALHMIFLSGYLVGQEYELNNDMLIVEICSMFVKLAYALQNQLLSINTQAEDQIINYKNIVKNIQKIFAVIYPELKLKNPSYHDNEDHDLYVQRLFISPYADRGGTKIEGYTTDEVYWFFQIDLSFTIYNLKKQQMPIEYLDKNNLRLLYAIMNEWWLRIKNNNSTLPSIPILKELENLPIEQKQLSLQEQSNIQQLTNNPTETQQLSLISQSQIPLNITQSEDNTEVENFVQALTPPTPAKKLTYYQKFTKLFAKEPPKPTSQSASTQQSVESQKWSSYLFSWLNPWDWYKWYYQISD